jgi:hypothetical protein
MIQDNICRPILTQLGVLFFPVAFDVSNNTMDGEVPVEFGNLVNMSES